MTRARRHRPPRRPAGTPPDEVVLAVLRALRRRYGGLVPLRLLYEAITLDEHPDWVLSPKQFIRISNRMQPFTPLDRTADVTNTFKKTVEIAIYGPRWDTNGKTDMKSRHDMPYDIEPMSERFALWIDKTLKEDVEVDVIANKLPFCKSCKLTPATKLQHYIFAVREPERKVLGDSITQGEGGLKSRGEVDLKVFIYATPLCNIFQCEYVNEFEKNERFSVWCDWVKTKNKYNRWESTPWITMDEDMEKCVDNLDREWENLIPDLRNREDNNNNIRKGKFYASKEEVMKRKGATDPQELMTRLRMMEDQVRQHRSQLAEMGIPGFGFHSDDEGGEGHHDEDEDEDGVEYDGEWDPEENGEGGHCRGCGGHSHRHVDDDDDDTGSEIEGTHGQQEEEEMEQ